MPDRQQGGRLSPAVVETISGITAGSAATLVVHPLDIVKTRMQIYRSLASPGSPPLTTVAVMRTLTQSPRPLQAMYRGLSVNIAGNAASWGAFFYLRVPIERFLLSLKTPLPSSPSKPVLGPQDYFLSSALAGAATALLTNPLWVLKTRLLSSDKTATGAYPGALTGFVKLWKQEGWRGFYRGLGISMFGVAHGAVHFAVYEPAKGMYLRWRERRRLYQQQQAKGPEMLSGGQKSSEKIGNDVTLLLSSTAKLVAGAVTYPYQVIRSRLQNYNAEERFGKGIRGVTVRVWREEGIVGFYRGVVPGVIRVLPATWITFLVYENVKFALPMWVK